MFGGSKKEKSNNVQQNESSSGETVALLFHQHIDSHVEVNLDASELGLDDVQVDPTYKQIQEYIVQKYNTKVSNLYIAQVKDELGLPKRANYNHTKKEKPKLITVTEEKREMILDAFKYFKVIE